MLYTERENYDIFLGSVQRFGEILPLTRTPDRTYLGDWSHDSKSIILAEDKGGNQRLVVYRLFIDSPYEMTPLTKVEPDYFLQDAHLSPNDDFLVYSINYDFGWLFLRR